MTRGFLVASRASKSTMVERVVSAAIDFGSSADAVTDAAAQSLGVNRTDMRVLALLRTRGQQSVGAIARMTGLSPAAATTVVRRLGEAGYAVQAADPADGRRTVVSPSALALTRLDELYGPMLDRGRGWLTQLTVDRLELLESFLREAESLQVDLATELRAGSLRRRSGTDRASASARATSGRTGR